MNSLLVLPDLWSWGALLLAASALVIGISKTSIAGFGSLAVAAFALVMPAKESTAAVLLLLIVGDIVAVYRYRNACNWALLRRLLPSVLPGVALGAWFLSIVDDTLLRRSIGALLTVFVGIQLWLRWRATREGVGREVKHPHWTAAVVAGTAAGFTTMTANAAGPVMTLYLLEAGIDKAAFIGTNAWFFLLVNVSKTPFSAALGLFPPSTLILTLILAPIVLLGTWIGRSIVGKVSQSQFDMLALLASAIAAVTLVLR